MSPLSPARYATVASAMLSLALGCASNVQDLGRDDEHPGLLVVERPTHPQGDGLGPDWATSPLARDLACPLTRPIEGDACPDRNTAPCTYYGAPEPGPGQPGVAGEKTTTFCMCMKSQQWRCVQGVTIRNFLAPPVEGDACTDSMAIERRCLDGECAGTISCRCAGGRMRCSR